MFRRNFLASVIAAVVTPVIPQVTAFPAPVATLFFSDDGVNWSKKLVPLPKEDVIAVDTPRRNFLRGVVTQPKQGRMEELFLYDETGLLQVV